MQITEVRENKGTPYESHRKICCLRYAICTHPQKCEKIYEKCVENGGKERYNDGALVRYKTENVYKHRMI